MPDAPDAERRTWMRLHDIEASDPHGELVDRSDLGPRDITEINAIMTALGDLRRAEEELSAASQRYMKLSATDMRAIRFLIVAAYQGELPTAGELRSHLGISSGATTKMLDRLARGGHVRRLRHPSDRRAVAIEVTAETRDAARSTMGRQQAGRYRAAARLTSAERESVTRFLQEMAAELNPIGLDWAQAPDTASEAEDRETAPVEADSAAALQPAAASSADIDPGGHRA